MAEDNHFPRDAIFIKFGRFQAGAFGRLAIIALIGLAVVYLAGKGLNAW